MRERPHSRYNLLVPLLVLLSVPALAHAADFVVVARDGSPVANALVSSGPGVPAAGEEVMDQVDKAFVPHVLAIPVGAAVSFPNSDQIRHHVYSFSEAKQFELRLYRGTPEEPVVFDAPGVVVVGCNIHDNMLAYIYVSDRMRRSLTDDGGRASLALSGDEVFVWHPALSIDSRAEVSVDLAAARQEDGSYRVMLDIDPPAAFPQAIRTTDRDRFRRFLDF